MGCSHPLLPPGDLIFGDGGVDLLLQSHARNGAYNLFEEIPVENVIWDAELQPHFDSHGLLQQLARGVGSEMQSKQGNSNAPVLCECDDEGLLQHLAHVGERNPATEASTNVLPHIVVWDDMPTNCDVHDGLLEQLAMGNEYMDDEKTNENTITNTKLDEVVFVELAVQHPEVVFMTSLSEDAGCSVFKEKPHVNVVWDEEPTNMSSDDGLLQQLACGKEYVNAGNTEPIVEPNDEHESLELDMVVAEHMLLPMPNLDTSNDTLNILEYIYHHSSKEVVQQNYLPEMAFPRFEGTDLGIRNGIPTRVAVWDQISNDLVVHEGLLQQSAPGTATAMHHGREEFTDKEKKPNAEFSYKLADIEEYLSSEEDKQSVEPDIKDVLTQGSSNLFLLGACYQFPKCDFSLYIQVTRSSPEQIPAWMYSGFSPGRYEHKYGLYPVLPSGRFTWLLVEKSQIFASWLDFHALRPPELVAVLPGWLQDTICYSYNERSSRDYDEQQYGCHLQFAPRFRKHGFSHMPIWRLNGFSTGQDELRKRHLGMDAGGKISSQISKTTSLVGAHMICVDYKEAAIFVRKLWDPGIWRYIQGIGTGVSIGMIILLSRRDCCAFSILHWMVQGVCCLHIGLAWGQASFSGGGNVMTQIWPKTSLGLSSPSTES